MEDVVREQSDPEVRPLLVMCGELLCGYIRRWVANHSFKAYFGAKVMHGGSSYRPYVCIDLSSRMIDDN